MTSVYEHLAASVKPIVVCVGGSGSSKSHSMAQLFIQKFFTERNKVFVISRKTLAALRITAYRVVVGLLQDYGRYHLCDENKTLGTITYGSNIIQFFGLDDPQRKKSFLANYIWLEEASEYTKEDIMTLRLCLKLDAGQDRNQLYMTFNPVDCDVFDAFENDPGAEWIWSTYHDNPFAVESFIDLLESSKEKDLNFYSIYALGKRGRLENIIYPHWQMVDGFPAELQKDCYGLDFGYENPSVCVRTGIMGEKLYLDEELYQTHLTNADLIERLKTLKRLDIYADSSEPQRIEELRRAGFNAYPAQKDVRLGIDTVKRYDIMLTKRSVNLIKEIRTYQRKKDKDGKILDEPVKFNDHGMDAVRYAVLSSTKLDSFTAWQSALEVLTAKQASYGNQY